jgi:hypothetical protein
VSTGELIAIGMFGSALIGVATGVGIRDRRKSLTASVVGTMLWIAILGAVQFWLSGSN